MRYRLALSILPLLAGLALAPAVGAEIYKWTDESGRVHFTQDLNQVPGRHRAAAEARAKAPKGRDRIQTYRPAARARVSPPAARAPSPGSSSSSAGRSHRIGVQQAGSSMRVMVRLNDRVSAPFIIDTGASLVALPSHVAEELGLDLSGARTAHFSTANGVIESPLVTLESVQLGTASARSVRASVIDGMREGLLGLSFFNHFTYNIDAQQGVVTLVENDMEETGAIRGGRSKAQWQSEYFGIHRRLVEIERRRDSIPTSHSRKHDELDAMEEELERQRAVLDGEADEAHVPFSWRD